MARKVKRKRPKTAIPLKITTKWRDPSKNGYSGRKSRQNGGVRRKTVIRAENRAKMARFPFNAFFPIFRGFPPFFRVFCRFPRFEVLNRINSHF
jgi:hypothetical protein